MSSKCGKCVVLVIYHSMELFDSTITVAFNST